MTVLSKRGWAPRAALLCVMLALAGLSVGATTASANHVNGFYCPTNPGATMSLNGGARCTSPFHTTFTGGGFEDVLTPVGVCVVLKPNSDGSGANIGSPDCVSSGEANIFFTDPGLAGYMTGINESSNFHTGFSGVDQYYTN